MKPNYTINSQDGRLVNVTLDFGNDKKITKNMQLQPVGYDVPNIVDGKLKGTKLAFKDPFDDLDTFFQEHMDAYLRGCAQEEVRQLELNKATEVVVAEAE